MAEAIAFATSAGYLGVDMTTRGPGNTELTCEPCQTDGPKARNMFEDAGIEPVGLASGVRFDEPIFPPVLGRAIGDVERPVRAVKQLVEAASRIEAPFVRVFAFELPAGESRRSGLRRITERLDLAARTARNTGVTVLLENGGSFPRAADVREILDMVGSVNLRAAYSPAVGLSAGEEVEAGLTALGSGLAVVKLKDFAGSRPVALGDGSMRVRETIRALARRGFTGWAVNEWLGPMFSGVGVGGGGGADATRAVLRRDAETLFRLWAECGGGPIREAALAV